MLRPGSGETSHSNTADSVVYRNRGAGALKRATTNKRNAMKLNAVERAAMNNPVRAAHQHHREAAWFRRLAGGALSGQRVRKSVV